jgi:uncharacterized membrane protein
LGNEPGWVLELRYKDVSFLAIDYGLVEFAFATPEPRMETGEKGAMRTLYETSVDSNELLIKITPGPCEDSMSGDSLESFVTVTLGERVFYGCGRALH